MLKLCAAGRAEQAPAYPATSVSSPRVQDSFSGAWSVRILQQESQVLPAFTNSS